MWGRVSPGPQLQQVYLAGPMRGLDDYNFPEFHRAAERLRREGFGVVSPAELDREEFGDVAPDLLPDPEVADNFRAYMIRDLTAVLKADGVALLPGWQHSQGALIEAAVSMMTGGRLFEAYTLKPVYSYEVLGGLLQWTVENDVARG